MAGIGSTTPLSPSPTNRVVNATNNAKQSPKRRQHKKKQDEEDELDNADKKSKKSPPGNNIKSHFDGYA